MTCRRRSSVSRGAARRVTTWRSGERSATSAGRDAAARALTRAGAHRTASVCSRSKSDCLAALRTPAAGTSSAGRKNTRSSRSSWSEPTNGDGRAAERGRDPGRKGDRPKRWSQAKTRENKVLDGGPGVFALDDWPRSRASGTARPRKERAARRRPSACPRRERRSALPLGPPPLTLTSRASFSIGSELCPSAPTRGQPHLHTRDQYYATMSPHLCFRSRTCLPIYVKNLLLFPHLWQLLSLFNGSYY
jgi:hypothetical protein